MTKKQTLHNPDPNADRQMFSELQALLEAELKKPVSKQDRALISELSSAIIDATIPESVYEESLQTGLQIQQQALRKRTETRKRSYLRPLTAVCTGLILLFVSNAVAIHATGYNLLELTYSIFDDSFEFRYPSDESSHVCQPVVSDDDPYGIRTECETKGFSPLVPKYLPEGAELSKVSHHETSQTKKCWFVYRNGSIKIMATCGKP